MGSTPRLKTLRPRVAQLAPTLRTGGGSWRDGKTTNERGYTYAWQKARERYLSAHPLCCMCEEQGQVTASSVVDHKVPHRGNQELFWDETNWQAVCKPCHDGEKQRQERSGAAGA